MDSLTIKVAALFTTVVFIFSSSSSAAPPSVGGDSDVGHKYELEIQKVLQANDTDFVVFQGLKVKRYNKTFYVADGKFSLNVDLDDTWKVECWCWRSKLGNNQWELTPLKVPLSLTSEFIDNVYIESIQNDLVPFSDLPTFGDDDVKIFPKGTYTITNYVADVRNFPPFLQDGTYRIEIFLSNEEIVKAGFIIYWKVYPEIG